MNHRRPFALRSWFYAALLFALSSLPAGGQTATATLSGTVADQNSAIVPSAAVTVLNTGTTLERHATTNDEGSFTIPLLPPGTYSVTARRDGFAPVEFKNVVLNVGDQKALQIQLKAGDVNAQVQIVSEASLVNTSPAVATTIDRTFVQSLPLNGRSFQSLILLTPGVTITSSGGSDFGQFSVNGQRASTNYFTVDGVSANIGINNFLANATNTALAGSYPGLSAFGGTNSLVSVDALEEFKIQTSTYSAEFGRQPGGQVQLVTRSGGNKFSGTLFEYFRNEALDARDYFNKKPLPQAALRQNQFGGTFSGPIFKDKTFFFFSYEGQRLRLPVSGTTFVPSSRVRLAAAAAVKPFLNAFPKPSQDEIFDISGQPTGWAPFNFSVSNPASMDATSIRIDHTFSTMHSLFVRYNESPSDISTYSGSPFTAAYRSISNASTRTITVAATSVFTAQLNNELRFNYSRQVGKGKRVQTTLGGAVPVDPALLTNGLGGLGDIDLDFGGFFSDLLDGDLTRNYQKQVNIVDNISLVHGVHRFKLGIDYRRLSPILEPSDQQQVGFFTEDSLNNGVADVFLVASAAAHPQFTNFSAYGQDTWSISPRLTLDFGLRWELNPAPTEADGKAPPVIIGITGEKPDVSRATLAPPGTPFYKTSFAAFGPRFGLAYQLNQTSGQETVVRGGFGVYYDQGSAGATAGFPLTANRSLSSVPFPLSAANAARPTIIIPTSLPVTSTVRSNDANLKLPYVLQWNISIERSLGTRQSISLSYVASAGRRLLTTQSLNERIGLTTGPRTNPNFAAIGYTWNGSTSDYNSMQAQYKARFKRIQALVNYTWSHAVDDVSSDIGSGTLLRGNADFDIRHNFSAALHYELPATQAGQFARTILGNWSIDSIIHAQSGRPVDIIGGAVVIDGMRVNIRPDLNPGAPLYLQDPTVPGGRRFNSAAFKRPPANPSFPLVPLRQGNFGRNVLRELPLYQVDLALGKTVKFTEQWRLQFKGEVFNILNHPMFANYGANFTSPSTFGIPVRTLSSALNSSGAGLNPLYQLGGNRSMQLSLRLTF